MKCSKCGSLLDETCEFCGKCGVKVIKNSEENNVQVKNNTNKQEKTPKRKKFKFIKVLLIIFLIISVIVLLIRGIVTYIRSLNKIYITSFESTFEKELEDFYLVEEQLNELKIKLKTFKSIEKVNIKLYSYNFILYEEEFNDSKKWTIDDLSLPLGISNLEVVVSLEDGNTIERRVSVYNTNKKNLRGLDQEDNDKDKLLNYEETIYGTNKDKIDTDSDGLTDYDEVFKVGTDPTLFSTYKKNISDALDDYDNDGLNNKKELELGTNVVKTDTDNDGLSDYYEVMNSKTNPKEYDTDDDSVSDYDEVINFKSDPLVKTNTFSGKIESDNREVGITLNNVTVSDMEKVIFEESGNYALSSSMAGYIMPAYNIETDIKITTSTISFDFGEYSLEKGAVPTIYYFNEKTKQLEELKTSINGTVASAVVNHFSTYILVDKNKLGDINKVENTSDELEVKDPINGEFLFYYSPVLASIFDFPIYIMSNGDISENQANIIYEKLNVLFGSDYEINFKVIDGDFGFNLLKNIFAGIYKFLYTLLVDGLGLDFLFNSNIKNNGSYVHNINDCLVLGYHNNIDDFGNYFSNGDGKNVIADNYILIDIDDKTDSNKDGISDSFTKAILGGVITTETGINPFEGYSYNQINDNKDFDDDGLVNGEEIVVKEQNGKYYLYMHSNPTLVDTDSDGLEDPNDEEPMVPLINGFALGKSLDEDINIDSLAAGVAKFNSFYNTGEVVTKDGNKYIKYNDNGVEKYSPHGFINFKGEAINTVVTGGALAGDVISAGDAAKAWRRYYGASGKTYMAEDIVVQTLNGNKLNKHSLFGSDDVQDYFKKNTKKIRMTAETNIKSGDKKVIKSNSSFTASGGNSNYSSNLNVFGFLHTSSGHMIGEISNDNGTYKMKLRYFIFDSYDWKNSEECDINSPACVSEVHYYNDMLLGKAKAFLVKIEYDVEMTWTKGEEPTIVIQNGTPYA